MSSPTAVHLCKIGSQFYVAQITDQELSLKLSAMGIFVGQLLTLENIAPLGCPYILKIEDTLVCIRKSDAAKILVSEKI